MAACAGTIATAIFVLSGCIRIAIPMINPVVILYFVPAYVCTRKGLF